LISDEKGNSQYKEKPKTKATTVNKKVSATQNDINCNWKATSIVRRNCKKDFEE
jgi:hypothetical protein